MDELPIGEIPEGWRAAKLGEACSKIGSGATPRGGGAVYVAEGTAFIRSQNVYDNEFSVDGLAYIDDDAAEQLKGVEVHEGDVLLNITGDSILRTCCAPVRMLPARVSQHVAIIRPKRGLDSLFLQKYLTLPSVKEYMLGHSAGGTRKAITKGHIEGFLVPLPPIAEQRAIAGVLGALDDKIESNRRLWSLALELLDGARLEVAEGNDTTPCSLGDVVAFNPSTLKPGPPEAELVYIDIASVSPGIIDNRQRLTWGDAPSRARRGVADGDIIFSTVRPGRRSFSVILDPEPGTVASTGFAVMTPRTIGTAFLLATVADPAFAEYCETVSQGSAYPAVSAEAMAKYEFGLPSDGTLHSIESELMPVLRRGHRALSENEVLTELRDALLPELLSGRLRVREAEEMVGSV